MNEPEIQRMIGNLARRIARLEALADGRLVRPIAGAQSASDALFDLYDTTDTTFKVRGCGPGTEYDFCAAGAFVSIGTGANGEELDAAITLSGDAGYRYVYLKDSITASGATTVHTVTLETGESIPMGGDAGAGQAYLYVPLWRLTWDGSAITWGEELDLRPCIMIAAMGN
jgi:hypothetical protein